MNAPHQLRDADILISGAILGACTLATIALVWSLLT